MSAQSMKALAKANEIRIGKCALKSYIASLNRLEGCSVAAEVIGNAQNGDEIAGAMSVRELISSVHKHGEAAVGRACRHAGILAPHKKLRDITPRQARTLALALESAVLLQKTPLERTGL